MEDKDILAKKNSRKWKIIKILTGMSIASLAMFFVLMIIDPDSVDKTSSVWLMLFTVLLGGVGTYVGIGQAKSNKVEGK